MTAYYNEFNPKTAHMLTYLIKDGLIAHGDVDTRPIQEVKPDDLKGYTQCHFFAGIGGWSVALRLAEWDDSRPVWTGSCPCQPFSTAGKQKGHSDERHLWPYWARLIRESKPATIYGEQVAGAITFGWWDEVATDLEKEGYSCAAAVLPACSVGSPHRRDRLWFMGNAEHDGRITSEKPKSIRARGNNNQTRKEETFQLERPTSKQSIMANFINERCQGSLRETVLRESSESWESEKSFEDFNNGWPISAPKICGVADGILGRTPILHAFGNAIVPQVAAKFIEASMI